MFFRAWFNAGSLRILDSDALCLLVVAFSLMWSFSSDQFSSCFANTCPILASAKASGSSPKALQTLKGNKGLPTSPARTRRQYAVSSRFCWKSWLPSLSHHGFNHRAKRVHWIPSFLQNSNSHLGTILSSPPPGDIWKWLQMFEVVMTGLEQLASSGLQCGAQLRTIDKYPQCPQLRSPTWDRGFSPSQTLRITWEIWGHAPSVPQMK